LTEAMADVHSEYLEEEIENQENVQMEMVIESANDNISILSEPVDADDRKREILEARSPTENNEKTVMSNDNIGAKTEAVRPMNLSLPEHDLKPSRLKYIAKIKQAKRDREDTKIKSRSGQTERYSRL